jgi:hypothetical protein
MSKYTPFKIIIVLLFFVINLKAQECITWAGAKNGYIPQNAVEGGKENGQILYIARANYMGGIHPGKIRKGWDHCCISFDGKEVQLNNYEVLVYMPTQPERRIHGDNPSKVSYELRQLIESSRDDWKKNRTLSSADVDRLKKSLRRISDLAYNDGCRSIVNEIDAVREFLNRKMPSREETMKKLDELYDVSKDCR